MGNDIKDEICNTFKCEPYIINGSLVSVAERERYCWTNIKGIQQPEDKGLVLKDIMETNVDEKYFYNYPLKNIDMNKQVCATIEFKNNEMHKRIFNPDFKVHTLTACKGGHHQKKVMDNGRARKLTPIEYERCMTLPDNYTQGIADTYRYDSLGNGWTAEIITYILSHLDISKDEEIVIVSMYDGIATGRYCFDKLGYKNITYYSYEIEPNAMKVANKNYPDIIQCGDAFQVRDNSWSYNTYKTIK
jgi:DNA (cytosine-5)-methyltransferase 3A